MYALVLIALLSLTNIAHSGEKVEGLDLPPAPTPEKKDAQSKPYILAGSDRITMTPAAMAYFDFTDGQQVSVLKLQEIFTFLAIEAIENVKNQQSSPPPSIQ